MMHKLQLSHMHRPVCIPPLQPCLQPRQTLMENLNGISGPGGDARSRARALFHARSALHLGKSYSSVGDIPNFSSTYHTNTSASIGNNILTRIITWNVGGADGTLTDPVKLEFLCNTMLIQDIHIALITECHADVASVKQKLRELHLHSKFRVRGQGKLLAWLIRTDTAGRIVQDLSLSCGRVSGIVLAGACRTRTLIIGIYGISGASTDHHCSRAQQELLASLVPTITDNQKLKHHVIVLGDFNVTPGHSWSTSAASLSTSISHLESWRTSLGKHFYRSRTTQKRHTTQAPHRGPQAGSNPFSCNQFTVPPRGSDQCPTSSQ